MPGEKPIQDIYANENILKIDFSVANIYMTRNVEKLMQALLQAQTELENIKPTKLARRRTFAYKYIDLGTLIDVVKPVASKYGLAIVSFPISMGNGIPGNATMVCHVESGQYIISGAFCNPETGIQESGATATYLRKYQLAGIGAVAADNDDDAIGNSGFTVDLSNGNESQTTNVEQNNQPQEDSRSQKTIIESNDGETMTLSVIPTSVTELKSGVHKVIGKDGKEHAKPWAMMKITTKDGAYITFDTKIAEIIKENFIGKRVTLTVQNTQRGPRIVGIITKPGE